MKQGYPGSQHAKTREGQGAYFRTVITGTIISCVGYGFVDDTQSPEDTEGGVAHRTQQALELW